MVQVVSTENLSQYNSNYRRDNGVKLFIFTDVNGMTEGIAYTPNHTNVCNFFKNVLLRNTMQ